MTPTEQSARLRELVRLGRVEEALELARRIGPEMQTRPAGQDLQPLSGDVECVVALPAGSEAGPGRSGGPPVAPGRRVEPEGGLPSG